MDEELIILDDDEVIETEIDIEDSEHTVESEEVTEIVEIENVEEIEITVDEAIGWVGGDNTRHYSLSGRDEPDQHPITAIIGLRQELNDIEALDVVYSDKRNQADYYLWEDENILQENRVGHFVSVCEDINKIKICTTDNDIFGVTVDAAGFVGAQSDVARDVKYGLVVTTGVVHVRCESSVKVGDYVVSNNYGYAQSNKNGYKVVGIHQIDGVDYAEITLVAPINRICKLSDDVEDISTRMDDAETNIVAAINVANAAYNKADEIEEVSAEAIKNALEALEQSNDITERITDIEIDISSANELAVQAKAIAQSAELAAGRIQTEAVQTSNNALTQANKVKDELDGLTKEMTPLTQWEGEDGSGIVGFVARANADSATLATLAEWKEEGGNEQSLAGTIAKVNEHQAILDHITSKEGVNGSTIAQVEQKADDNSASITSLVASVDKYSVGEYSQAYGLTREQAEGILKPGYIYVPTVHKDKDTHSEKFEDTNEENWFTPGNCYEWNINDEDKLDWIEYASTVIFQSSPPANSNNTYKYWYLDSNKPMEGYESYALYIWEDSNWKMVNTLAGNASNRAVSMIRQTTNEIAAEVTNARGDFAGLNARLEADREAQVAMVASVVNDDGTVNTASIVNSVNESGSSVTISGDHIILNGATTNGDGSFQIHENGYMIANGGYIGNWNIANGGLDNYGTNSVLYSKFAGINSTGANNNSSSGHMFWGGAGKWVYRDYWDGYTYKDDNGIEINVDAKSWDAVPTNSDGQKISPYMSYNEAVVLTANKLNIQAEECVIENILTYFYAPGTYETTFINKLGETKTVSLGADASTANFMVNHNGIVRATKLELGNIHPADADGTGSENSNNFILDPRFPRIIFDPDRNGGSLYMLKGKNDDGTWDNYGLDSTLSNAFLIADRDGLKLKGKVYATDGEFTGKITAKKGNIGGYEIGESKCYKGYPYDIQPPLYRVITDKTDASIQYEVGMKATDGKYGAKSTDAAFYVWKTKDNWTTKDLMFAVRMNGGIVANSGTIGSWTINNTGGLSYGKSYSNEGYIVLNPKAIDKNPLSNDIDANFENFPIVYQNGYSNHKFYVTPSAYVHCRQLHTSEGGDGNSDINIKNSIEIFSDEYEVLFDNLKPCRFKYNYSNSDRYHTGFIAQEVSAGLEESGLTSQDFAALVHLETPIEGSEWQLRKDEFVALNTWQIQRAKARITELEEKVAKLEALIKGE